LRHYTENIKAAADVQAIAIMQESNPSTNDILRSAPPAESQLTQHQHIARNYLATMTHEADADEEQADVHQHMAAKAFMT
jgi:hypothetical protein